MKRKRLELKRADHSPRYPLAKLEWGTCCRDDAHGVVVKEFQRKAGLKYGPGYRAGLRDNDVIVAFGPDGEIPVESAQQARTYFDDTWDAGAQSIWVTLERDEETPQKRKGADLKVVSLKERAEETSKRAGRAGGKNTKLSLRERLTPACVKRPRSPAQPPPPPPKPPAKPQHHPEFLALLETYQTLDNIWSEGPKLAEWGSRAESFPKLPERRTGRLKKVGPPAASVQAPEDERPHYQADWDQVTFAFHMPDDHGNRTLFPDEHHDLLWVGHSVDIQVVTQFCALMERELRERLRSEWGEVLLPEPFAMGPGVELPSLRRKPKPKNSFLILRLGMGAASGHFVLLYANHENPKKKTVFVVDSLMTYTMGSEYANEYVGHVRKAAAALMRAGPNDRFDIVWLDTPQQKSGLDSCGALACFYLYAMTEAIWPHEVKVASEEKVRRALHDLIFSALPDNDTPYFGSLQAYLHESVADEKVREGVRSGLWPGGPDFVYCPSGYAHPDRRDGDMDESEWDQQRAEAVLALGQADVEQLIRDRNPDLPPPSSTQANPAKVSRQDKAEARARIVDDVNWAHPMMGKAVFDFSTDGLTEEELLAVLAQSPDDGYPPPPPPPPPAPAPAPPPKAPKTGKKQKKVGPDERINPLPTRRSPRLSGRAQPPSGAQPPAKAHAAARGSGEKGKAELPSTALPRLRRRGVQDPVAASKCNHCGAVLFQVEAGSATKVTKKFCCEQGEAVGPPLQPYLSPYYKEGTNSGDRNAQKNASFINMMLAASATSFEGGMEKHRPGGPQMVKIRGRVFHTVSNLNKIGEQQGRLQNALCIYDAKKRKKTARNFGVDFAVVNEVHTFLSENNPIFQDYQSLAQHSSDDARMVFKKVSRRTHGNVLGDMPKSDQIAGVLFEGDEGATERGVTVWKNGDKTPSYVDILDPAYEALAYPMLFPNGEAGWEPAMRSDSGEKVSQMMRHRHLLLTYPRFAYFARLTQEYVVDMYVRMEENRLRWVRFNQKQLRMGSREELIAALGEDAPYQPGRVFLPTSFIGGPRYMDKIYRDSMRIVTRLGSPNFFITFTCNPKWPDIVDTEDTVMIARVFKAQLDELLALIRSQKVFKGDLTYLTGVIEWQKRGLPHCHLVLKKDHEMTMEYIDSVVCAEIPSEPHLRDLAKAHMLHGPHQAGAKYPAPCEDPDTHRCTKNYPKAFTPETYTDERGFVQYRRRDIHRGHTMKGGKSLPYDNSWVVPFNRVLLETFQAHINVEVCSTAHVIKYLFKYMTKGGDQSLVAVVGSGGSGPAAPPSAAPGAGPGPLIQPPGGAGAAVADAQGGNVPGVRDQVVDEIKNFQSARWIGANQAAWRILGFPIQFKSVANLALCIHLEGRDQLIFDPSNPTGALERQSQLSRYLNRPLGQEFADLTYVDYYESFVEYRTDVDDSIPHPGGKFWVRERKRGVMVCRIYWVSPNLGEIFYLRLLLIHFPARSYKELRTVLSVEYETFQEACKAHGLIEHTQEQLKVLRAADEEGFHGPALRHLFLILTLGQGLPAKIIWDNGKDLLAQDFLHDKARGWDKDWAYNEALKHLTRLLSAHGKTLDSLNLPACRDDSTEVERERERWVAEDQGTFRDYWEPKLTPEQSQVYQTLLQAVESQRVGMARKMYMLDALAGSGKTLVLQVLTAALRARGHVVLVCASTGIAAQNHMGGTTAHSLFGIPIDDPDGKGVCSVTNGTQRAALIRSASLIIIDELLMLHRYAVRSINRLLDDVGFRVQPIVVGAGDFRQCAPVVKWGSREDVVKASPKFARNWAQVHQLSLSKNMRAAADPEYAAFVKAVGEDTVPPVDFPNDSGDPNLFTPLRLIATVPDINKLIQFVFPDLTDSYTNVKRGILSGTNDTIDAINSMILERLPGGTEVKLSADKARTDEGDALHVETETLNALNEVGNPPHRLPLKVGAVVMITRNLNQAAGLVNSTKAIIRAIQPNMVIVEVPPTPTKGGRLFPIPRITFQFQPGGKGFNVLRTQFPLRLAYAITTMKSQGQTLERVGLDVRAPPFSHGMLYVGVSRVRQRDAIKALADPERIVGGVAHTRNVVFPELLGTPAPAPPAPRPSTPDIVPDPNTAQD